MNVPPRIPQDEAVAGEGETIERHNNGVSGPLGIVLTGGGARGAYQTGVLRWIARQRPDLAAPILTGVSAGAVNVALLASHEGSFRESVDRLCSLWLELTPERVFKVDAASLLWTAIRWGFRLMSGGAKAPEVRAFLNTTPLRRFLHEVLDTREGVLTGIGRNIARGSLSAVAMTTTSYSTGQTVVFVQGAEINDWQRPQRRSESTTLTVEHIMASAALPLFFPAVRLGNAWYGDGGVRLTAPLSPALHLGAGRVMAISTRYDRSMAEAEALQVLGYPPPAQVLGSVMNAVFLDLIDQDALRLHRLNDLLVRLPPEERLGLKPIDLLVLRPSADLGKLAAQFEPQLPKAFRFMTRGLGTQEQKSPDMLSMLMFQPDYIGHLMSIGERDAQARSGEILGFLDRMDAEDRAERSAS
jgi:NTE family protein